MKPITSRFFRRLPTTVRGWIFLGLGSGFALLSLAVAVVAFSMWTESRYVGEETDNTTPSFTAHVRRVVTKPVVGVIGRQVENLIRRRMEILYSSTGLTMEEAIARFLDERTDLMERGRCAYRLARVGSPEAIAALLQVFRTAPADQKAFLAQLIGSTGNPAAKDWLLPLLNDPDENVVIAAIRGLSVMGKDDLTPRLAEFLADAQRSERIRIEAALGLGDIGTPAAREALTAAFPIVEEDEVATQVLNSLGKFPFSQVADLFGDYLTAPETPSEMRVVAVEALAYSTKDAVPFLVGFAERDADADVRSSSAWAISLQAQVKNLAPTLADLVQREEDPDVRRRLYEALLPQSDIPATPLLPKVLAEEDIAARVAGFNVLGRAAAQAPASEIAASFDQVIVPELMTIATSPNSLNIQMRAVFALRQAQTPAAQQALAVIASTAPPQIATVARHGLRTPSS
jgi:HEAT repeat protein